MSFLQREKPHDREDGPLFVGRYAGVSGITTAFELLRDAIIQEVAAVPVEPRKAVLDEQIVWGRSPVRLDLAGGWSDTPPYCVDFGGCVVNLASDLNGQPPIQVFARVCEIPRLVIRSVDSGREFTVTGFEELLTYATPGDPFALAKAAFVLAGFGPGFSRVKYRSLRRQLLDFGGGIELTLVAAVPRGSGLGTSSILGATILSVLSELCGLGWDNTAIMLRTLALEQMLTTGGGWQDQAGALFPGVKMIETVPGLVQQPCVRWLPGYLFGPSYTNRLMLLYYTGVTRLAKNILGQIVAAVFRGSKEHLKLIEEIKENAYRTQNAIQRCDYDALAGAVARSWELNQKLDPGTNPPAIRALIQRIGRWVAGLKLLGAGGGGYMLILAKDEEAAVRIRKELGQNRPNGGARFVDFSLSETGLVVTRS